MVTRHCAVTLAAPLVAAILLSLTVGCGPKTQASKSAAVQSSAGGSGSVAPSADRGSDVVHATATGKRYHRADCRSLSRSDIAMTRAEAEAKGLTPCKVCKP